MSLQQYKCPWCGDEFKRDVIYVQGDTDAQRGYKGKKSSLSTQVKCYKCGNFIQTWDTMTIDGRRIKIRK